MKLIVGLDDYEILVLHDLHFRLGGDWQKRWQIESVLRQFLPILTKIVEMVPLQNIQEKKCNLRITRQG